MTSASVADSAEVEVYASWALILVRMVCPSVEGKSLYHRSKQDKSRPNRTRVYSFGSVVHESIAKREAKGGLAIEVSSHALCPLGNRFHTLISGPATSPVFGQN